jgi:lipopolysaccharide transport system ATP-binding protein
VIAFSELGKSIEYPVRTYSTGMKARLAFSMLLMLDPEILVIDEALSVGDAFFARKATRKIREICDSGKLVLIVSHSTESVREMCNRCLWMDQGRIVMDGTPQDVTAAYTNAVRHEDERAMIDDLAAGGVQRTDKGVAARPIYRRGEPVVLDFSLPPDTPADADELILSIMRADGLLVSESKWRPSPDGQRPRVGHRCRAVLEPALLAAGVYRIDVQVRSRDGADAAPAYSTVLEVVDPAPPVGGRPVLVLPPCRLQVSQAP